MDYAKLTAQARQAAEELLQAAHLETGDIFVVGCSSSEIMGGRIGMDSSMEAAAAVLAGVLPPLQEQGVYLAAQCCEHLNRSIVIEREVAKANGYQIVSAIPQPHAGGSWATCFSAFLVNLPACGFSDYVRISAVSRQLVDCADTVC